MKIPKEILQLMQQVKTLEVVRCGLIGDRYPGAVNLDLKMTDSPLHIGFDIDQKYLPIGIAAGDILYIYHLRYILYAIEKDITYNESLQERVQPAPLAKWDLCRGFGDYPFYRCSACKKWNDKPTDFCPRCGAKMEGGAE